MSLIPLGMATPALVEFADRDRGLANPKIKVHSQQLLQISSSGIHQSLFPKQLQFQFPFEDWIHNSTKRRKSNKRLREAYYSDEDDDFGETDEIEELYDGKSKKKGKKSKKSGPKSPLASIGGRKKPESFEKRVEELLQYRSAYGHTNVSRGDPPQWISLAHWVNNQRAAKKIGHLKEDRIRKLESIGFLWEMRPPRKYHTPESPLPKSAISPVFREKRIRQQRERRQQLTEMEQEGDEEGELDTDYDESSSGVEEGSTTEEESSGHKRCSTIPPASRDTLPPLSEMEEFFIHEFASKSFWQRKSLRAPILDISKAV